MTLFRTAEPAAEPVTLADVKAHLRLDGDREDALLSGLIKAARCEVERATGCALLTQEWRLLLDRWPRSNLVVFSIHPVRAVVAITVFDGDGHPTVLDPGSILLDGTTRPARLLIEAPPAPGKALNGIEIDLRGGFGHAGTDVPDLLKRAVILLAAHWFEFRTELEPAARPASFPRGYERLIAPYQSRRL